MNASKVFYPLMSIVPITSAGLNALEVSWFSALCSDDYQYLGMPDGALRSSWEHCSQIVQKSEANGFRNVGVRIPFWIGDAKNPGSRENKQISQISCLS